MTGFASEPALGDFEPGLDEVGPIGAGPNGPIEVCEPETGRTALIKQERWPHTRSCALTEDDGLRHQGLGCCRCRRPFPRRCRDHRRSGPTMKPGFEPELRQRRANAEQDPFDSLVRVASHRDDDPSLYRQKG